MGFKSTLTALVIAVCFGLALGTAVTTATAVLADPPPRQAALPLRPDSEYEDWDVMGARSRRAAGMPATRHPMVGVRLLARGRHVDSEERG
jgi:hypothetical protein